MSGVWFRTKICINRFLIDWAKTNMVVGSGDSLPLTGDPGQFFWKEDDTQMYHFDGAIWETVTIDAPLFDFDAHAEAESLLPVSDIVGLKGLTVERSHNEVAGGCLVGVSVASDYQLMRHDALIDSLFEALKPGSLIPLYDMVSGANLGRNLVVLGGTQVISMSKANNRPVQFIAFEFQSDLSE